MPRRRESRWGRRSPIRRGSSAEINDGDAQTLEDHYGRLHRAVLLLGAFLNLIGYESEQTKFENQCEETGGQYELIESRLDGRIHDHHRGAEKRLLRQLIEAATAGTGRKNRRLPWVLTPCGRAQDVHVVIEDGWAIEGCSRAIDSKSSPVAARSISHPIPGQRPDMARWIRAAIRSWSGSVRRRVPHDRGEELFAVADPCFAGCPIAASWPAHWANDGPHGPIFG